MLTLAELIQDIHTLNRELELYESKYGLLSKDFYKLYQNGNLPDEDVEQIDEYGRWTSFYKIKLEREAVYDKLVSERLTTLWTSLRPGQPVRIDQTPMLAS